MTILRAQVESNGQGLCRCGRWAMSRTRKLITQIAQVCQELRAIANNRSIKATRLTTQSQLGNDRKGTGPQSDTCAKGERDYTRSGDSKTCDHYEGQHNSPNNPARHDEPSPPVLLPSGLPSATSSHASSEASSSSTSTPSSLPPCGSTGDTSGSIMALSSFQNETKELESEEQDSRGGGLPCPDETSEWRSLNKVGIGDCLKSPKMGHWQHAEGVEF